MPQVLKNIETKEYYMLNNCVLFRFRHLKNVITIALLTNLKITTMGKSKSIEEKMAEDQKFRDFMKKLEDESKLEEDRISGEIGKQVKTHYEGNNWDHARLFGNKQSDYQNYDDWSLDRVNKIIDSIGNALSGGDFPSKKVPGSEDASKSTIDNAKDFIGVFAGDYSLVIARVKAMISAVLSQFSVASDVSRKAELKDMPLSGGMHLFFGSSGAVSTNNTFFTNQFIGSFQIVFEVYMSVAEAKAIGLQQMLVTTEIELKILDDLIIAIRQQMADSLKKIMKDKIQDFVSTKAAYDVALDSVKLDRAKLMEEYDKYNQVTKAIDALSLDFANRADVSDGLKMAISSLDNLFLNEWELDVAKRYLIEKAGK